MAMLSMWYTHTLVFLYFILGGSFILFGYKFIFACAIFKSENSLMFGKTLTCSNTIYINEHDVKLSLLCGASLMAQLVKNLLANAGDMRDTDSSVGKTPWRGKWQYDPVFLPGKFHGQGSLLGYSPWGCKDSDTTEWLTLPLHFLTQNQNTRYLCNPWPSFNLKCHELPTVLDNEPKIMVSIYTW